MCIYSCIQLYGEKTEKISPTFPEFKHKLSDSLKMEMTSKYMKSYWSPPLSINESLQSQC